jgi:hypothetical protein
MRRLCATARIFAGLTKSRPRPGLATLPLAQSTQYAVSTPYRAEACESICSLSFEGVTDEIWKVAAAANYSCISIRDWETLNFLYPTFCIRERSTLELNAESRRILSSMLTVFPTGRIFILAGAE